MVQLQGYGMQFFITRYTAGKVVRQLKLTSTFFTGLLVFAAATSASAQNMVINGDFEQPNVSTVLQTAGLDDLTPWLTFYGQNGVDQNDNPLTDCADTTGTWIFDKDHCNDGTLVPGWRVVWSDTGEPGRLEIQRHYIGEAWPHGGDQKAELDTHHRVATNPLIAYEDMDNNVSILQTLNTCPGGVYEVSYWWKPRTSVPGDSSMSVIIDDQNYTTHNSTILDAPTWQQGQFAFSATKSESVLQFRSWGQTTTFGVFLDDVSVVETVPCSFVPPQCTYEPGVDVCESGMPSTLELSYDASSDSAFTQSPGSFSIEPLVPSTAYPQPVTIKVYDSKGIWMQTETGVNKDDTFVVIGQRANGKIGPRLTVEIWDENGALFQTVMFHTSCSEPLFVGDEFGGISVVGFTH